MLYLCHFQWWESLERERENELEREITGHCSRIISLSWLSEYKQIMGFIIVNYKVVHQEPMLYDRVIHLVALVTPRPQEQWSFVLISKHLQGMEWGRHRKQCGCVHWLQSVANAGYVIVCILLYSQKPLATCPNSIFYDRALQVVSYHSQPSIIASLLWPLAVLGVSYILPLMCPISDIL